jgi:hypothetical protein
MKAHLIIFLLFASSFNLKAQERTVDSLIARLSNQGLFGVCNYVWVLKNGSKEADLLIKIGRKRGNEYGELCRKLYSNLLDTSKGVICHYILSNIVFEDNLTSGTIYFDDPEGTIEYNYNGLRFIESMSRRMYAEPGELEHNRKVWRVTMKAMGLIE